MGWGAIAAAGIGAVTSIIGGSQQRSAASAANAAQKKQINMQYARDKKEWKMSYLQAQSDYAWQVANTEAQRYQDRVRQSDYEAQQGRIIDAALTNLKLNSEALRDQYIYGERLRARQEINDLNYGLDQERLQLGSDYASLGYEAATTALQNEQNVAAYINSIQQRGLQADLLIQQKQDEGKSIQEQIVLQEQLDSLRRDGEYVTALVDGADRRAGAVARSGGSNSARRLAMDSMKEFGRSYGLMRLEQQRRRTELSNYNASLNGETATQLALIAKQIEGERDKINFTKRSSALSANRIEQKAGIAQARFGLNAGYQMMNFRDLTVPSFELARRAGSREFDALLADTINTVSGAQTPYREAIIFDPLEPIAGLKPEKGIATPVAAPTWGSILTGAAVNAASGALSMSYTKEDGSLGFR